MSVALDGPVDLVVFDCDGVLVDSEPIANRVFTEMLNEIGLRTTLEETMRDFVGRSMKSCLAIVAERLGDDLIATGELEPHEVLPLVIVARHAVVAGQ